MEPGAGLSPGRPDAMPDEVRPPDLPEESIFFTVKMGQTSH